MDERVCGWNDRRLDIWMVRWMDECEEKAWVDI